MMTKAKYLVGVVSMLVILGSGVAEAGTWWRYHVASRTAPIVVIKARCLLGEDSAAHLKLLDYNNYRVVYGCYRHGY